MDTTAKYGSSIRIDAMFLRLACFWSLVIVALAAWNYWQLSAGTIAVARSAANQGYDKDIVYRRWATMQGGVYAPATPETPPNPYLSDIPERDITTPAGKKLTLINPAYMTRQVHELGEKSLGVRGHITSLRPIRPENAPDAWEAGALRTFESGQKEASSIEPMNGDTYLRFMRPLVTEAGCLKCHAKQGYRLGDIRGGISVSIPWGPYRDALRSQALVMVTGCGGIWAVGLLGLHLGRKRIRNHLSERQRAEEALTHSHNLMRYIIEHDQSAVAVHDRDLRYVYVSQRYLRDYNVKEQDVIGKHHYDVFPDLPQKWREVHRKALAGEISSANDDPYVREDGSVDWTSWECRPWYDAEGSIGGIIVYTEVITDRRQAEADRRVLEERLQRAEKMEALGTLAGGVAHDLNNVLGIVVGYSEMLLESVDQSSPLRQGLESVMGGGLKAAAIVDDLLTLARRGVPGRGILNLNTIIAECQRSPEVASLSAHHPSVTIKTDVVTDLLNISGSSVHIGKTLYNLISNATEAMPEGGCVTIKTINQYLDRPIQGYDQIREGDYVLLSVSDTGEGIHGSDLKRIFEPFYTKKVMGRSGTGLGLAVVWGTVKDHHGYIDVHSVVGEGSTFTLYFPVTREAVAAERAVVAVSEYTGKGESILIVDDIREQRDLAVGMLRTLNYVVSAVASGEEALAHLKEHEVDLLVLDMIMDPGLDGLDTYEGVLKIRPTQRAIIVSGFSESDRVRAARVLGAGEYLRKPYIKEKLGLAVRKELDRGTGLVKPGHPHPESNLSLEENRTLPLTIST